MTHDIASTPRDRLLGLAAVATSGLIWGTIPLIIRFADGASIVKVFFRVFCAGVVIGTGLLVTGGWRELGTLSRRKLSSIVVQGLILTLNWALFLTAFDMTTVATAELLGYMGPIIIAVVAPFVTGERFDRRIVLPLLVAVAGIATILVPQGISVTDGRSALGALLAFLSALTYATLMLRSKKLLRGVSSGALMIVEYTVASLVLLPFVIAALLRGDMPTTPASYGALIALGVFHTALSGYLFLFGLRRVRTDHAAILTYMEPASAVLFAALLLPNEPLTWTTALGGALVIAGGVTVALMDARAGIETLPMEAAVGDEGNTPEVA